MSDYIQNLFRTDSGSSMTAHMDSFISGRRFNEGVSFNKTLQKEYNGYIDDKPVIADESHSFKPIYEDEQDHSASKYSDKKVASEDKKHLTEKDHQSDKVEDENSRSREASKDEESAGDKNKSKTDKNTKKDDSTKKKDDEAVAEAGKESEVTSEETEKGTGDVSKLIKMVDESESGESANDAKAKSNTNAKTASKEMKQSNDDSEGNENALKKSDNVEKANQSKNLELLAKMKKLSKAQLETLKGKIEDREGTSKANTKTEAQNAANASKALKKGKGREISGKQLPQNIKVNKITLEKTANNEKIEDKLALLKNMKQRHLPRSSHNLGKDEPELSLTNKVNDNLNLNKPEKQNQMNNKMFSVLNRLGTKNKTNSNGNPQTNLDMSNSNSGKTLQNLGKTVATYATGSFKNVMMQALITKIQGMLRGNADSSTKMNLDFETGGFGQMHMAVQNKNGSLSIQLEVGNEGTREQLMDHKDDISEQLKEMGYSSIALDISFGNGFQEQGNHKHSGNEDEDNVKLAGNDKLDLADILAM